MIKWIVGILLLAVFIYCIAPMAALTIFVEMIRLLTGNTSWHAFWVSIL